jgi:hypothetical protein
MEFKDYKEKQAFYRKASKTAIVKYASKRGGKPYNKELVDMENQIKELRLQRLFGKPKTEEVTE